MSLLIYMEKRVIHTCDSANLLVTFNLSLFLRRRATSASYRKLNVTKNASFGFHLTSAVVVQKKKKKRGSRQQIQQHD